MLIALFVAGLAAGVVLNSLADDLPPDELGVRHRPLRPHCLRCGRTHRPWLWLSLAALLLKQGRCEYCGGRRMLRGAAVELVCAMSLPLLWIWAAGGVSMTAGVAFRFVAAAVLVLAFILVVVIDVEHRLILRIVVLPAAVLVAVTGFLVPGHSIQRILLGGLAGYGIMFSMYLLGALYTIVVGRLRGRALSEVALGGGDVNLAMLVGLAVGWPGVVVALVLTVVAGGLYSLGLIMVQVLRRRYSPHMVMPYGPFLVLGGLAIYLFGPQIARVLVPSG
jgi:prepilin signal peptidase PulO-like enzyme (type II secretory pathway)